MHRDLELAAGGLVDVGRELHDVLGVEVGGGVGRGHVPLGLGGGAERQRPARGRPTGRGWFSWGFSGWGSKPTNGSDRDGPLSIRLTRADREATLAPRAHPPHEHRTSRPLAVLDRPRRHVHRRGRPPSRRRHRHAQAPVGEPGALPGRGHRRHPPLPRGRAGRADPGRADRGREDGHHRRHQRPPRAQGRAHGAPRHPRLPRPAAHRLPEPAAHLRPPHQAAGAALPQGDRGGRARGRPRRNRGAAGRGRRAPQPRAGLRRGLPLGRRRVHARLSLPGARGAGGGARARGGLHAGLRLARREPAHEDRLARRHDGGGRVPVADPA